MGQLTAAFIMATVAVMLALVAGLSLAIEAPEAALRPTDATVYAHSVPDGLLYGHLESRGDCHVTAVNGGPWSPDEPVRDGDAWRTDCQEGETLVLADARTGEVVWRKAF